MSFEITCFLLIQLSPGASSCYACFWVLEMEPLGGANLTTRQRLVAHPVCWVCLKGLAVMNTRQATQAVLAQFWGSGRFGMNWSGGNQMLAV